MTKSDAANPPMMEYTLLEEEVSPVLTVGVERGICATEVNEFDCTGDKELISVKKRKWGNYNCKHSSTNFIATLLL